MKKPKIVRSARYDQSDIETAARIAKEKKWSVSQTLSEAIKKGLAILGGKK
jgi:hypothetical protein